MSDVQDVINTYANEVLREFNARMDEQVKVLLANGVRLDQIELCTQLQPDGSSLSWVRMKEE